MACVQPKASKHTHASPFTLLSSRRLPSRTMFTAVSALLHKHLKRGSGGKQQNPAAAAGAAAAARASGAAASTTQQLVGERDFSRGCLKTKNSFVGLTATPIARAPRLAAPPPLPLLPLPTCRLHLRVAAPAQLRPQRGAGGSRSWHLGGLGQQNHLQPGPAPAGAADGGPEVSSARREWRDMWQSVCHMSLLRGAGVISPSGCQHVYTMRV